MHGKSSHNLVHAHELRLDRIVGHIEGEHLQDMFSQCKRGSAKDGADPGTLANMHFNYSFAVGGNRRNYLKYRLLIEQFRLAAGRSDLQAY